MAELIENANFGSREPFSLGVEEELFLVEPDTGFIANVAGSVVETVGDTGPAKIKSELHACHIELITDVCSTVSEAIGSLVRLRAQVLQLGVGLLGSGTHPSALEGDAEITQSERYERISALLGDAVATPVAALHIHIGMPDTNAAIRAFNGLRRHLPLLEALGANSPFRHGRDTGFASAREITIRGWPRSGAPREMADFDDFREFANRLTKVAGVPDYTYHWWKLRPHPRLGTVEIRALDSQPSLRQTAALVALVQCLARREALSETGDGWPPGEILEEASYQAARSGTAAQLPDPEDRLHAVGELAAQALDLAAAEAEALGCEDELQLIEELLEREGGAGIQRAVHAEAGIEGVLNHLVELAGDQTGSSETTASRT